MKDEGEYLRTDEMYYDDEDTIEINEEGFVVGYNDMHDSDGNTRTSDDKPTWETDYHPGNEEIFVNENGEPFDLHEFFDSDGKPIRKFSSESSESESSKSDNTKKNW